MADETERYGDLEVNEDLEFQRHDWAAERIGWAAMALVVLMALLDFLGGAGLLGGATAGDPGAPLSIEEYQRFLHYGKPTTLRVRLDGAATEGEEARLWLSREYLENVQLQEVTPEPKSVEAGPERLTCVFEVGKSGQPMAVTFNVQADKVGPLKSRVGLQGGRSLGFWQLVYP